MAADTTKKHFIRIRGANVNNLKNLSVDIPSHRPPSKETEETIRNSDHSPEHHLQRHPFQIRNGQGNHSASEWKKNLRIKLA